MNIQNISGNAFAPARVTLRTGLLAAACLLASAAMVIPEDAFAQRGRGGGGRGTMARSSVSGASRGSMGAASTGNRMNSGNRGNAGDRAGSGNRGTTGDAINSGNRVNTGDINIDRGDINIDRGDINVDGDLDGGWDVDHPIGAGLVIGTAAAIGASIAIGSMYYAVPPGCPIDYTYATPYYHCGGYYYREEMHGDEVVYVVVEP